MHAYQIETITVKKKKKKINEKKEDESKIISFFFQCSLSTGEYFVLFSTEGEGNQAESASVDLYCLQLPKSLSQPAEVRMSTVSIPKITICVHKS